MKRAEVFKARVNGHPYWHIDAWTSNGAHTICTERDTHAEALTYAIESVGLDAHPEHKEPS